MAVLKVVVIGPESTGKSSLCEKLAEHFDTEWCPEYARAYLTTNGKAYQYNDLLTIAKSQVLAENTYAAAVEIAAMSIFETDTLEDSKPPVLFIDTDMYVMKVWCEYVFDKCHQYILEEISTRKYDLYILCNVDMPWVQDELREYPDDAPRQELYQIYKDLLINQSVPWIGVSGNYEERLATAITAVNELLNQ